jgi:hypothetical protein
LNEVAVLKVEKNAKRLVGTEGAAGNRVCHSECDDAKRTEFVGGVSRCRSPNRFEPNVRPFSEVFPL